LSRPFPSRNFSSDSFVRVNGKIRAREVRVIGVDGQQLGVISLNEALTLARQHGVDLVEIAATAVPPVCRLVNLGKFRYEKAKKEKESKKNQNASIVKEVQLSPRIDPHDLGIKIQHAVGFLCEDMKVKVALKFRGREMAHQEFGFEVIKKFLEAIAAFGHPDFQPKLIGRGINVMISPLPRNKRAKNPYAVEGDGGHAPVPPAAASNHSATPPQTGKVSVLNEPSTDGFVNNPFDKIEVK
jgi:translation initiation factor IF-3